MARQQRKRNRTRSGFTLVEMVLVLAIVGVMGRMAMVSIGDINTKTKIEQAQAKYDATLFKAKGAAAISNQCAVVEVIVAGSIRWGLNQCLGTLAPLWIETVDLGYPLLVTFTKEFPDDQLAANQIAYNDEGMHVNIKVATLPNAVGVPAELHVENDTTTGSIVMTTTNTLTLETVETEISTGATKVTTVMALQEFLKSRLTLQVGA